MENETTTSKPEKKSSYTGWILAVIIIIGATLPFHYIPSALMVFPKDNLTFSNTFITPDDIHEIVKKYNDANYLEKEAMKQEPFLRKLMSKGIIIEQGTVKDGTEK